MVNNVLQVTNAFAASSPGTGSTGTTSTRSNIRKDVPSIIGESYTIYCDLDGVLVDFEHGVRQLFPPDQVCSTNTQSSIEQLKRKNLLWQRIQESKSFFEQLQWAPGGKQLWDLLRSTSFPIHILTGVPTYQESRVEKFRWCQRELNIPVRHRDMAGPFRLHVPQDQQHNSGSSSSSLSSRPSLCRLLSSNNSIARRGSPVTSIRRYVGSEQYHHPARTTPEEREIEAFDKFINTHNNNYLDGHDPSIQVCNVITCWSERKHHESRPGAVLIDDRIDLKDAWEQNGGIFIHHRTGDTANTVRQLLQYGIIDASYFKGPNGNILEPQQEQEQEQQQQQQHCCISTTTTRKEERDESLFLW